MNNPFISIIVPVYKVERYLPRCIESILGQTCTNFELILVDDGTPDRSGIICDRYAEKDSRIRVIHKENGGVSTARNAGIDAAKGEWITFVDSDDWVSNDYLDVLLKPLNLNECDLIVGAIEWRNVFISSSVYEERLINVEKTGSQEILNAINRTEFYGSCLKLFKREIIEQNQLRYMENVAMAEDAIFVNNYLVNCKTIFMTGRRIYFYNELNTLSVTNRFPYFENMQHWSLKYIQSYEEVLEAFEIAEPYKTESLQKKAIQGYSSVAKAIVFNLDELEAKKKIGELYIYYKRWFDCDVPQGTFDSDRNRLLKESIQAKNIDYIYTYFSSQLKKKPIDKLKKRVKRQVVCFLERYRDGVKKYKF